MLADHAGVNVPKELGDLRDADTVDQRLRGEGVSQGVADDPLKMRKPLAKISEAASHTIGSEAALASWSSEEWAFGILLHQFAAHLDQGRS